MEFDTEDPSLVYILLFNKCIYENIAVLNNEIMSSKIESKRPLS